MKKLTKDNIKFSPDYNPNNLAKSIEDTINDTKNEEQSVKAMKKELAKGHNPINKNDFKLDGTHPTLRDDYRAGIEDLKKLKPITKRYQHSSALSKGTIKKNELKQDIANLHDLNGYPSQTAKTIKLTEQLPLSKKEQLQIKKYFKEHKSLKHSNLKTDGFSSNAQLDEDNVLQSVINKYKIPYPNLFTTTSKPSLKVAQSIMHKPQDEKVRLSNTFKFMKDGMHSHKTFSKEHDFMSKVDYESVKSDKQFRRMHKPTYDDKIAMQYRNKMSSYLFEKGEQGLAYDTAKKILAPENMERINYQIQHPNQDKSVKSILKSTPKKLLKKHHKVNHNIRDSVQKQRKQPDRTANKKYKIGQLKHNNNIEF